MPTPDRRAELEKTRQKLYEIWGDLDKKILLSTSPLVRADAERERDEVKKRIAEVEQELKQPDAPPQPVSVSDQVSLTLPQIRDRIVAEFSLEELADLCFNLGVDYESLPGESKPAKARELVSYMQRRNRLPDLVNKINDLRVDEKQELSSKAGTASSKYTLSNQERQRLVSILATTDIILDTVPFLQMVGLPLSYIIALNLPTNNRFGAAMKIVTNLENYRLPEAPHANALKEMVKFLLSLNFDFEKTKFLEELRDKMPD